MGLGFWLEDLKKLYKPEKPFHISLLPQEDPPAPVKPFALLPFAQKLNLHTSIV
jgi:hypothetical protein